LNLIQKKRCLSQGIFLCNFLILSVVIVNSSPTQDSPKKTRTNISAPSTPSRKNRAYVLVPDLLVSSNDLVCCRKTPSTPSPAKKKGYVADFMVRAKVDG
jgi:hypothetical protein